MTLPPPVYDLVLLLDQSVEDDVRATIVTDVEQMIAARGWRAAAPRPVGNARAVVPDQPSGRRRVPPVPVPRSPRAAAAPRSHAAHHRRRDALSDHQAEAGHARRARPAHRAPRLPTAEAAPAAAAEASAAPAAAAPAEPAPAAALEAAAAPAGRRGDDRRRRAESEPSAEVEVAVVATVDE